MQRVVTIHPTEAQMADPRFEAFRQWFHEVSRLRFAQRFAAGGPGNVTFF